MLTELNSLLVIRYISIIFVGHVTGLILITKLIKRQDNYTLLKWLNFMFELVIN